jgi:hypothetical protein
MYWYRLQIKSECKKQELHYSINWEVAVLFFLHTRHKLKKQELLILTRDSHSGVIGVRTIFLPWEVVDIEAMQIHFSRCKKRQQYHFGLTTIPQQYGLKGEWMLQKGKGA